VLPEGVMLNYLARKASPVAAWGFFSASTSEGREEQLVRELEQNPPERVVIVSRDLREYGIQRYGEKPGSGKRLLEWLAKYYELAFLVGDDPLDYRKQGGAIFQPKKKTQP
jgi:hypothetical protein